MAFNLLDRYRVSKDFYQLNIKYLVLVGLWPKENWSKTQQLIYKIYENTLHCFSIILLVITGVKTYQIRHEVLIFLANIDKTIVAYNYFFKVIFFLIRRKELRMLVDEITLAGDQVTEKSKNAMMYHVMLVTVFNTCVMLVFSVLVMCNGDMSFEAWMPFDAKKDIMSLALANQIVAVLFFIPFSYRAIGMQGIVCSIMIYLCDQLKSLQKSIQNFKYYKDNETEARENFKMIIMKHTRLMRNSTSMKMMFKEYFVIQNISITMELCLNAMVVTMVGTSQKILLGGFLSLLCLALLNAYIYCKLGNELIDQSESVALSAYSSDWTSWPRDLQKNVLLIIMISQKPFHLSAGGMAIIDLQTFSTALYNGYSIFAVLNDMVES